MKKEFISLTRCSPDSNDQRPFLCAHFAKNSGTIGTTGTMGRIPHYCSSLATTYLVINFMLCSKPKPRLSSKWKRGADSKNKFTRFEGLCHNVSSSKKRLADLASPASATSRVCPSPECCLSISEQTVVMVHSNFEKRSTFSELQGGRTRTSRKNGRNDSFFRKSISAPKYP